MSIQLLCTCSWTGRVKDELLGKRVRCPNCKEAILVTIKRDSPSMPKKPPIASNASKNRERQKKGPSSRQLQSEKTKECPACDQANPLTSTLCRYCGEFLDGKDVSLNKSSYSESQPSYDYGDETFSTDDDNPFKAPTSLPPRQSARAQNQPSSRPAKSQSGVSPASGGQEFATPVQRIRARIFDGLIAILVGLVSVVPLIIGIQNINAGRTGNDMVWTALIWALVCWVVFLVWWIRLACRGKSPGKQQIGIHVLDLETGQPAGFLRNYLIRDFLVGIIYGIPVVGSIFLIAEIVMLFLPARRTVRDLIANTSVVQD